MLLFKGHQKQVGVAVKINNRRGERQMKKYLLQFLAMAALALVGFGCSKLTTKAGSDRVPNEQINADIATQIVNAEGGDDWNFSKDSMRCFKLYEAQSTISDTEANLSVLVAAAQGDMNAKLGTGVTLDTAFGGLRLLYKKKGDSWVLEKASPDKLSRKRLSEEGISTFFEISAPVCSYFDMKNPKASK